MGTARQTVCSKALFIQIKRKTNFMSKLSSEWPLQASIIYTIQNQSTKKIILLQKCRKYYFKIIAKNEHKTKHFMRKLKKQSDVGGRLGYLRTLLHRKRTSNDKIPNTNKPPILLARNN
jgi:hypothetical protein